MDIEKRKEELKKKIDKIRKKEKEIQEKIIKKRYLLFEKLNKYRAIVKITDYSSCREIIDCDGIVHKFKIGSILDLPLPNAIPLVKAGIGVILAKYPRKANIPKITLCKYCKCSSSVAVLYEIQMPEGNIINIYEFCPYCGKILRTLNDNKLCKSRK